MKDVKALEAQQQREAAGAAAAGGREVGGREGGRRKDM